MRRMLEPRGNVVPEGGGDFAHGYPPAREDYLQIRDYVRILIRRRWIVLTITSFGLVAAFVHNWRAVPIFEASARLLIEGDANVLGLDRPVVDRGAWARDFQPTQIGILESFSLARHASEDLKRTAAGNMPVPSADEIREGLSVEQMEESRLVSIAFRSPDPALAARVADAVAQAYVADSEERRSTTVGTASTWLTQQVEEQRKLVQSSEAALQRYREQHGADVLGEPRSGEQPSIVRQKLGELQEAVTKARAETIEKDTQWAQLASIEANQQGLDTLPAIGSNSFIQGLKGELTGSQQKLAQASEKLGERHPEIIKLRAAVENAERKLQSETAKLAAAIRNERDAARARESALTAALERQKAAVQELNAKSVQYTAIEREAEANRQQLDNLLQRAREAILARDVPGASARLLDAAEVPFAPVLPRKKRNLAMGAVGGGILSLALVFLLELFNNRLNSPEDVARHLRLPLLGVTPQVKSMNGHALLLSDGAPPEFAELLHSVRTSLILSPEFDGGKTLLVTSSQSAEGKTVTAANLAMSLARLNLRVLLIDADLRRPRLHELFGVEQRPGLTDVLTGRATHNALYKTKVPHLWLMPSGLASRHAADLLGSQRLNQLIECFREQFDWIVLDSPPVLAVTDACLMARVASGVLFVVGCGKTTRDVASAAVDRLDAVGANMVGALLNGAELGKRGESYLPYYHQDYGYYPQRQTGWLAEAPEATLDVEAEQHRVTPNKLA